MEKFDRSWLKNLWRPTDADTKFGGGQVTIVGGSSLFHGAPILALRAASRLVSMVYFASPEADREVVNQIKAALGSFIWVPFEQVNEYVKKSDAVLVGPGMMRNKEEGVGMASDSAGKESRAITMSIITKNPNQKYVIDGGALQVISASEIPPGSVITPNRKEYAMLFSEELIQGREIEQLVVTAKKYHLIIVHKAPVAVVTNGERTVTIEGGNPGLVTGAVGDVIAGLTVGFLAKNEPILAAGAAIYLVKRAADRLLVRSGMMFNADDLAEEVTRVFGEEVR